MNEKDFDDIMGKYMKNDSSNINIDNEVMTRIRTFEEKRSGKYLRFEYVLSAFVFVFGIVSIALIQIIFNNYIPIPQMEQYVSMSRWFFTGIFGLMIFATIFIIYFSSLFKSEKEIL